LQSTADLICAILITAVRLRFINNSDNMAAFSHRAPRSPTSGGHFREMRLGFCPIIGRQRSRPAVLNNSYPARVQLGERQSARERIVGLCTTAKSYIRFIGTPNECGIAREGRETSKEFRESNEAENVAAIIDSQWHQQIEPIFAFAFDWNSNELDVPEGTNVFKAPFSGRF
jgi:hypothetical protein